MKICNFKVPIEFHKRIRMDCINLDQDNNTVLCNIIRSCNLESIKNVDRYSKGKNMMMKVDGKTHKRLKYACVDLGANIRDLIPEIINRYYNEK